MNNPVPETTTEQTEVQAKNEVALRKAGRGMKFVGDNLVVTDPDLLAKTDRAYWSASAHKTWHKCPASFVADKVLPRANDPMSRTEEGTAGHYVLELLYAMEPEKRTKTQARAIIKNMLVGEGADGNMLVNPEYYNDRGEPEFMPPPVDKEYQWYADVWKCIRGEWDIQDPRTVNVHSCETPFDVTIGVFPDGTGGVPMRGKIDRLEYREDGTLRVVDTKTGKHSTPDSRAKFGDEHGDQGRTYQAVMSVLGQPVTRVSLHYTGTRDEGASTSSDNRETTGTLYDADTTSAAVEKTVAEIRETWGEMKAAAATGVYETRPQALCGWCPLVSVCPAAAEAGKVPKVDEGWTGTLAGVAVEPASMLPSVETGVEVAPPPPLNGEEMPNIRFGVEVKPWEDPVAGPNPSSSAVAGYRALAAKAQEVLGKHYPSMAHSPECEALAVEFAAMVYEVESRYSHNQTSSMASSLNTVIRGGLYSVLDDQGRVPPLGQGEAVFASWRADAIARIESMLDVTLSLVTGQFSQANRGLLFGAPTPVTVFGQPEAQGMVAGGAPAEYYG